MIKKVSTLLLIFSMFFLVGCEMSNTPTKKVEEFLNSYKNLDEKVTEQMDNVVNSDDLMNDEERSTYKDILRKQYQDLMYEIKNEVIDGDVATVTAEIEVYDFYKATRDAASYYSDHQDEFTDQNGAIVNSKYIDYRLNAMKETKERVKYTLTFTLSKVDKIWILDDIDDYTRQKIHGLYAY